MAFDTNGWGFTPDDSDALRQDLATRLKAQADGLLRAFEAVEPPKDHTGIDKAAKALISVAKAVKEIYAADPMPAKPKDIRDVEMNDDAESTPDLAEYRARAIAEDPRCAEWADWQFKLERKLTALAERRAAKGQASRDDGERSSTGMGEHLGA